MLCLIAPSKKRHKQKKLCGKLQGSIYIYKKKSPEILTWTLTCVDVKQTKQVLCGRDRDRVRPL